MEQSHDNSNKVKEKIVAQKAVIAKGDTFLILLRSKDETAFPGLWDFPGGKLEKGEDPRQSVEREVKEETGLRIKANEIEGTYTADLNGTPVEFIVYSAEVPEGGLEKLAIGPEHSEYKFATTEEIKGLETMPYMEAYFKEHSTEPI